jgi:hypothetical protein
MIGVLLNDAQCTIVWCVNDLNISHEDPNFVREYIDLI